MKLARCMIDTVPSGGILAEEAARLGPWFHNLHLPDGTETAPNHPLGDFPRCKWLKLAPHLPEDLTGWTALDIGCNSGFYSIELARRGAMVTAIDHDPRFIAQARWSVEVFGMKNRINVHQSDVYQLAKWTDRYDLILFMGVFYHLRHPLLALDIVARMVKRLLVFQTLALPDDEVCETPLDMEMDERGQMLLPGWPKMAFIEHSLACDPTNWWVPNHAAIAAMLRSSGLEIADRPLHETYLCHPESRVQSDTARRNQELLAATNCIPPMP